MQFYIYFNLINRNSGNLCYVLHYMWSNLMKANVNGIVILNIGNIFLIGIGTYIELTAFNM